MDYPEIEKIDGSLKVTIDKGISYGYEPENLQFNQSLEITRGGRPIVSIWGAPTRFYKLDIQNIGIDIKKELYDFFYDINFSGESFYFYPFGKDAATDIFDASVFDPNVFDTAVLDDEKFRVILWQNSFSMPINSTNFSSINELVFFIEEELS